MSLQAYAQNAHIKTPTRVERDRGGLDNTPASASDRDLLREHLGRDVLHGSVTRDFKRPIDATLTVRTRRVCIASRLML